MEEYTEAIRSFYANSEPNLMRSTDKNVDEFKKGMDAIVKKFCKLDGFRHVITEMAFLKIRAEQEVPRGHSIIPVILNGDSAPFDELLIYMSPSKLSDEWIIHKSQILHELFFRVLTRLFENLQPIIQGFESCYQNCVKMLSPHSNLNLPSESEFVEEMSKEILKTIHRLTRDGLATMRKG
jgi:hypothetical protein